MRAVAKWAVAGVFALFFTYDVWEAIGNFVGIYAQGLPFGLVLTFGGWVFLLLAVFAPIILFILAAVLSRKMSIGKSCAIFAIALMISSVIFVDITLTVPLTLILG